MTAIKKLNSENGLTNNEKVKIIISITPPIDPMNSIKAKIYLL